MWNLVRTKKIVQPSKTELQNKLASKGVITCKRMSAERMRDIDGSKTAAQNGRHRMKESKPCARLNRNGKTWHGC